MKIGFVGFGNMASAIGRWLDRRRCGCERYVRLRGGSMNAFVERCEARGMVACRDAAEVVAGIRYRGCCGQAIHD